ncbi:MAG: ABC transporter permease [Acidobacteriota bacterium]
MKLLAPLSADFRYALRSVRKDLRFFALAVLIVGIGIGACASVFSVLSPLVLRDLPFRQADRLVWIANEGEGGMSAVTSRTKNLSDFRELSRTFEGLTGYFAFFEFRTHNLIGSGEPTRLVGVDVAGNFLDVLGVDLAHGRNFLPEESVWGGRPAIILTHGLWQRHFAADPAIVGRSVTLGNEPHEVVGVLPASFDFASVFVPQSRVDFLKPFPISDETDQWGNTLSMIGRLRDGATVKSAQADLDAVLAGLREADPERWGLGAVVTDLRAQIAGPFQAAGWLLAAASLLVMVIVSVNLSNLLLARGSARAPEMAVRSVMGASRWRLMRQLLVESSLFSLAGSLVGLGLAVAAVRFVRSYPALEVPLLSSVRVDGAAFALALALALVTALVAGSVPAWIGTRSQAATLRAAGRGASSLGGRWREAMVVVEVALACSLLITGGLLLKSFFEVLKVDLGYETEQIVRWQLNPTRSFEDEAPRLAYYRNLVSSVEALPSVDAVGLTDTGPLGKNRAWGLSVPGFEYDGASSLTTFLHMVDPGYLPTLRIELLEGRIFTAGDTADTSPVVVLNETAARDAFKGEPALGRTVMVGLEERQVVGVVADIRHRSVEEDSGRQAYLPVAQGGDHSALEMMVRSSLPAAALAPEVISTLQRLDSTLPVQEFTAFSSVLDRALSARRFTVQSLAAFAAAAVLLAVLGLYGVLSCAVDERVREFGVRMALGATGGSILRRVLGRSLLLVSGGLMLGLGAAYGIAGSAESLLYGVDSLDPAVFFGMPRLLLGVGAFSGLAPALRAAGTELAEVLRAE